MINKKELNARIKKCIQVLKKYYDFQSKQLSLYKKINDYFLTIMIYSTGKSGNKLVARAGLKPFLVDDILWEVFDMKENLSEPLSLRADGAFAFSPLEIMNEYLIVTDLSQVEPFITEFLESASKKISDLVSQFFKIEDFYEFSQTVNDFGLYDKDLMVMLINIKNQKFSVARNIAENCLHAGRKGRYAQGGKYIYEYVVDYCLERE